MRDAVVPRLTTSRLVLRELRASDFETYAANSADPVATHHMGGPVDRRTAWRIFGALTGAWLITGAGWWAVELAATGELAGMVGAFYRETNYTSGADADLELGWVLFRNFWGKGYASEAVRAALRDGFARQPSRRAIAQIDPSNEPSIRVALALGMTLEGNADFYGTPVLRYATTREAWRPT